MASVLFVFVGEARSVGQQDPQIANVIAGWAGKNGVADRIEQRKGIELL